MVSPSDELDRDMRDLWAKQDEHGMTAADERVEQLCQSCQELAWAIATTVPTSMASIAAVLRYANEWEDDGEEWPDTDTIGSEGWHYQRRRTMAAAGIMHRTHVIEAIAAALIRRTWLGKPSQRLDAKQEMAAQITGDAERLHLHKPTRLERSAIPSLVQKSRSSTACLPNGLPILHGDGFTRPRKPWSERGGRFYPRVSSHYRCHSLGGFATAALAEAVYASALDRLKRGEPAKLEVREKANSADLRRLFTKPTVCFENEGERVIAIEPEQDQSVFLMHNALNGLHPRVKKFVVVASNTGDLTEAATAAGLSKAQVAMVLPRLKIFLGPLLR
jgi:hypothetical protein